jgi:hypothetical protein
MRVPTVTCADFLVPGRANRRAHLGAQHKGGTNMRIWIAVGMLMATTVGAYAANVAVPEIDAFSGLAAMAAVGSIAALIWERRRK